MNKNNLNRVELTLGQVRAELRVEELGIPNFKKSWQAMPRPAAGPKVAEGTFPWVLGTLRSRGCHFLKISWDEIIKSSVFQAQEAFFGEVSLPKSAPLSGEAKKRGCKSCRNGDVSLTSGRGKKEAKSCPNTRNCAVKILAQGVTTNKSHSGAHAFSLCRKQNRDFLDKKTGFLLCGEKWRRLGWPTIIIIKNY